MDRYFPNPWVDDNTHTAISTGLSTLAAAVATTAKTTQPINSCSSPQYCLEQAIRITEKCLAHYEPSAPNSPCGSLYCGSLGARCYLRYCMAKRIQATQPDNARQWLQIAMQIAQSANDIETQTILEQPSRRHVRVTLLESPWVGSKVMQIILLHQLGNQEEQQGQHIHELLEFLSFHCQKSRLPTSECDVLYGRAGALHAILFLRMHCHDASLGSDLALSLARDIIAEGHETAKQFNRHYHPSSSPLPLLWKWHDTFYLGAAHGVVGILYMLLSLTPSELHQLSQQTGQDVPTLILQTMNALSDTSLCSFPSGNLNSSIKIQRHESSTDRLVHWCHGGPGFILLLIKAEEQVFGSQQNDPQTAASTPATTSLSTRTTHQQKAQQLGHNVVWPRGLLHKGVGLCHGISGNAYAMLALARCNKNASSAPWLERTQCFASFAVQHYWDGELEHIPDRPYSLYEGAAGLACLLLDLSTCREHSNDDQDDQVVVPYPCRFPLFEV